MGEAFFRRGEHSQAAEHFRRGLAYLGYQLPMTRGEVQRGLVRELLEQVGHRLLPRLFLKPTAALASPAVEDEAYIYFDMSTGIDLLTNSERSLLLTLRLLNLSERRGYPLGVTLASSTLGVVLTVLGLSRLAGWYGHYALTVALKHQLPLALGNAYLGLQVHGVFRGELDQSLEHGRQAAQAFHEAGESVSVGAATSFLAWASIHQGKLADGLAHSGDMIRLGQDTGARNVWCWGETPHGYALRRLGRLAKAIAHQQKAIELAEAVPDYTYRILAGAELGLCYLRQGDYDRAVAELELCQRVAAEHHIGPYGQVTPLNNLAEAHLLAAEHGDAAHRAMRLRQAQEACRAALKHAPRFQPKLPKAMRLQGTYEWLRGNPAKARDWWQKSLTEAERMGLRYDVGEIYLDMGQRLNERTLLEKAEAIFAEIGAAWDLARTRECLRISHLPQ
jgi:tetratricopeptide (TPR) repeat protein